MDVLLSSLMPSPHAEQRRVNEQVLILRDYTIAALPLLPVTKPFGKAMIACVTSIVLENISKRAANAHQNRLAERAVPWRSLPIVYFLH